MKTKSLGGCPRPLWIVAAMLAVGAGVTACGGGGSGGGGGMPMLPMLPSTPPAPAPVPAPAPAPPANRDPAPGSEPLPSLSAPQPGSIAATGNGSEGLYEAMFGYTYVGADGGIASKFVVGTLAGSIRVTGLNWVFGPDTNYYFTGQSPVTGSGTFSPKVSMDGTYAYGGRSSSAFGPSTYSVANALAVGQDSVIGKWANTDASFGIAIAIEVDAAGAYTGTMSGAQVGTCKISGTLTLAQPATAKNAYGFRLTAVNGATTARDACKFDNPSGFQGPAAITLVPAGNFVSNGYFRSIAFLVHSRAGEGSSISASLRKQP